MDGETDWKLRKSLRYFQSYLKDDLNRLPSICSLNCQLIVQEPIEHIYTFNGLFQTNDGATKESLGLDNTIWANCILASGKIYGNNKYIKLEKD